MFKQNMLEQVGRITDTGYIAQIIEKPAIGPAGPAPKPTPTARRGPVHPIGAQRQRHRLELERRFAREISRQAGDLTAAWRAGGVVLITEPRLLGLMRQYVREDLNPALELKELARNYVQLSTSGLGDRLTWPVSRLPVVAPGAEGRRRHFPAATGLRLASHALY